MKKILKNGIGFILTLALAIGSSMSAMAADDGITVFLDGRQLVFAVEPQLIDGSTYVPVRTIFEALGATITWNQYEKSITSVRNGETIVLYVDSSKVIVGREEIEKTPTPKIVDGSTLVPLRSVRIQYN